MRQVWLLGLWAILVGLMLIGPARADEKADLIAAFNDGLKLHQAGNYQEAAPLYEKALQLALRVYGENHEDTAGILNNLANLYSVQGRYADAEPIYVRSLAIREKVHGKDHPQVAHSLHNLANLYSAQSKYADAEPLYLRSLSIREKVHGKDHPEVAQSLHNLATLYRAQGRYSKAEPLHQRSLSIKEKVLGKDHPDVALSLNNLANLYSDQGKYAEAEPLYLRSLSIWEKVHGKDHPDVANSLENLANLYKDQGKYAEAEPLYLRSLSIREKIHGKDHPSVARSLNNLAMLFQNQGKYAEAEPLFQRSLPILEKVLGRDHLDVAVSLNNLATLYKDQGKYAEAEPLFQRSLSIREKISGKDHPDVRQSLNNLVNLYSAQGKYAESTRLLTQLRKSTRNFLLHELPALSVREQRDFLNLYETARFSVALSLGYRRSQDAKIVEPSAAWLLNGKAIALESQTIRSRLEREVTDPNGRAALRELQAFRAQESALALKAADPRKAEIIGKQREQLETRRRELEKKLAQQSDTAAKLANPWVELTEVRKLIPADGVLIDIAIFRPYRFGWKGGEVQWDPARYVAWLIPAEGQIRIVDLGEADKIDAAIKASREVIEKSSARLKKVEEAKVEAEAVEKLAIVSKLIFEPIKPHLGNAKKLIVSPDGNLWLLPWAALPVAKDRYLIEDYSLRFVVSGRDLIEDSVAKKTQTTAPLILADPDYDLGPTQVAMAMRNVLRVGENSPVKLRLLGQRCQGKIGTWNVSFEFQEEKVVIRDEDNGGSPAGEASWTVEGDQLTMRTKLAQFTGKVAATTVSGERTRDGTTEPDRWEFALPFDALARNGETRSISAETKGLPRAPRLPGTLPESRQAFAKLKTLTGDEPKLYKDAEASEALVKATKSPKVLMLATHGFFLKQQEIEIKDDKSGGEKRSAILKDKEGKEVENPLLRCGLLLAGANKRGEAKEGEDDGILTGLEIVGLDLRGTQLVILSACETGIGDIHTGEGVAGLRQAFQLAGAESVLATLWQISDEATVRLMNIFYDELAKGTNRAEALTLAQRQFLKERRERYGAAHPVYWASFTMTGR